MPPLFFLVAQSHGGSAYRAPELFFCPPLYDAYAIDLWSLGVTIADFFTAIKPDVEEGDPFGDEESPEGQPSVSHYDAIVTRWYRESLFSGAQGSFSTIASIIQRRGSPRPEIWPVSLSANCSVFGTTESSQDFKNLPHSSKINFNEAEPAKLSSFMPHLPRPVDDLTDAHFPPEQPRDTPLDLLHRFLVYPPERRLTAEEALTHPWFAAQPPLVLPTSYPESGLMMQIEPEFRRGWQNQHLGEWLQSFALEAWPATPSGYQVSR